MERFGSRISFLYSWDRKRIAGSTEEWVKERTGEWSIRFHQEKLQAHPWSTATTIQGTALASKGNSSWKDPLAEACLFAQWNAKWHIDGTRSHRCLPLEGEFMVFSSIESILFPATPQNCYLQAQLPFGTYFWTFILNSFPKNSIMHGQETYVQSSLQCCIIWSGRNILLYWLLP